MRIYKEINEKLEKIYNDFKKDEKDLTGWDLCETIHKESGYDYGFLMAKMFKELYKLNFKNKEIIISSRPLKEFIKLNGVYFDEEYLLGTKESPEELKNIILYNPKNKIKRGIMINVLEKIGLGKTLKVFCEYIILMEEEINFERKISRKKLGEFKSFKNPYELVLKTFQEEIGEKDFHKNQKRIFKFK